MATEYRTEDTTSLTLDIWHPNCWTLEVTAQADADLIAHTVYKAPSVDESRSAESLVRGHFTAYADTTQEVKKLVAAAEQSEHTQSVMEFERCHDFTGRATNYGNASCELFVEYNHRNTISDALLSHGFIHDAPVRVRDGREYWPVVITGDREDINARLDSLREEKDADVSVRRVVSSNRSHSQPNQETLSERQREVFELACTHDYYAWPRGITTKELAKKTDISKTTLLEHLRKAEAKLLDQE
ncbi:helix-turn-helix domain-containing protein [Natrialba sp. PRR66]|uniref:helix-turn-helix domain-containing protein n=1 Tax=Natrialba sp. PRR66 TaxID=3098146 RepID=UPI002B1E1E59|nr:helix-turn-helix domain-containing protein [Natrialba sp. PRR66]